MNCFSKNPIRRKCFHVVTPDSIKVSLNEISLKITDSQHATSYCKISLHTNPDYVRIFIDNNETSDTVASDIFSHTCESVSVNTGKDNLQLNSSQINVRLQYEPWKLFIYKRDKLLYVCKIEKDKVNKKKKSFVTEINAIMNIYGLAERASMSQLKHGKKYRLYNTDEFGLAQGTDKPLYGSVPYIVGASSDVCIGILCRNESDTSVHLTKHRMRQTCRQYWSSHIDTFDFVCLAEDNGLNLRKSFLRITGSTPIPPLFALGYHQCRWNYENQEDVIKVDTRLREAGIPCDVLWLDIEHTDGKRYFTWDKANFEPQTLIKYLKENGRHLVVIIDPHLRQDPDYEIYREALDAGFLVKNEDGTTFIGECWPGNSAWVDYINDAAAEWWGEKICLYLKQFGSNDRINNLWIWNDMNEPSVFKCTDNQMKPSALHANGIKHSTIHNRYGQRMAEATWKGIMKACDNKLRPFVLSRSFYTGSQKYGAIWTGDTICSWDHLRISVSMILSLSICGIDFCGADVGGFFGDPEPELLCRWYQLGAFQPFFRAHAHIDSQRREPYLIDEPYSSAIKQAVCLRYQLLAYWYLCFWQEETQLLPVVSSIWIHFPQSHKLDNDSAFMIGSSILVRPIVSPLCRSITMTVPGSKEDSWYHQCNISNKWQIYRPRVTSKIPVNLESIPVFYRTGHCIFMKEGYCANTAEWQRLPYNIVLFPDNMGSCSGLLYVDDYHTFAYRSKDQYALHRCTLDGNTRSLSLETLHKSTSHDLPESCLIVKITIVKNESLSLSECKSASLDKGDGGIEERIVHQFSDKIEIIDLDVPLNIDWNIKMN